jgi:PTH1 family peptidyl-tRNA hydrolase
VRLGIGHPGDKSRVQSHVLGNFAKDERTWLDPLLSAVAEAAPSLADADDVAFMNRIALLTTPRKDAAPKPKTGEKANKPTDE